MSKVEDRQPLWSIVASLSDFSRQNLWWQKVWTSDHCRTAAAAAAPSGNSGCTNKKNDDAVPYWRIVFLFVLWQALGTWYNFVTLAKPLIGYPPLPLPFRTGADEAYRVTRDSHRRCAESICRHARDASFSCEMGPDGLPRLDLDSVSVPGIPFTDECREAIMPTSFLHDMFAGSWLLQFPRRPVVESAETEVDFLALMVVTPSCAVAGNGLVKMPEESFAKYLERFPSLITATNNSSSVGGDAGQPNDAALLMASLPREVVDAVSLMGGPRTKGPRETFEPRRFLCYDDDMDADMRAAVDAVLPVYEWLLRYYRSLLAWVIFPLVALAYEFVPLVVESLPRALALRVLMSWFGHAAADSGVVTFRSTARALLLLQILLAPPGWLLWITYAAVLAPTAAYCATGTPGGRPTTAATTGLNWLFLFVATTSLAASSYQEAYTKIHSLLGGVSLILSLTLDAVLWLAPGVGWTKMFGLVSIYQHVMLCPPPPTQEQQPSHFNKID